MIIKDTRVYSSSMLQRDYLTSRSPISHMASSTVAPENDDRSSVISRPLTDLEPWRGASLSEDLDNEPQIYSSPERVIEKPASESKGTGKLVRKKRKIEAPRSANQLTPPPLPLEVRARTAAESLDAIPRFESSVWSQYTQMHELEMGGTVNIAEKKGPLSSRVLIRRTSNMGLDNKIRLLTQLHQRPYFLETTGVFLSDTVVDIVCEYMDLSLEHILGVPRFPTEKEVAAIVGQVGNLSTSLESGLISAR
jgi:hypothetical protein